MSTNTDEALRAQYVSSPPSTDPVELLAIEQIRTAWLRQLLSERTAELADREQFASDLLVELSGIDES
jgi:hypothetical protein